MTQPLFIWFAVVTILAIVFVLKGLKKLNALFHIGKRIRRFIQVGPEDEMFYCPGDKDSEFGPDKEVYYSPGDMTDEL